MTVLSSLMVPCHRGRNPGYFAATLLLDLQAAASATDSYLAPVAWSIWGRASGYGQHPRPYEHGVAWCLGGTLDLRAQGASSAWSCCRELSQTCPESPRQLWPG